MVIKNEKIEAFIKSLRTNKYLPCGSTLKNEDRTYTKKKEYGAYQIFILLYDWNKFSDKGGKDWGVQFEFHLVNPENRCDLVVSSDKLTIKRFEAICKRMYFTVSNDSSFKEVLR